MHQMELYNEFKAQAEAICHSMMCLAMDVFDPAEMDALRREWQEALEAADDALTNQALLDLGYSIASPL